MKKITFFALATAIIFFGCSKKNDQSPSMQTGQTTKPKILVANAGLDTSICMPFGGTGNMFEGILDGRASHDSSGKIVSYSWWETFPANGSYSSLIALNDSLVVVKISGGVHTYRLEVQDDQGRVDYDTVRITANGNFEYEYDGLSWDSAVGKLTTISERFKPGLIQSWPDFTSAIVNLSNAYIINYEGECNALSNWKSIPYVPYDSIQLTNIPLFYTLIAAPDHGILFPEIFAQTNSGINYNQKVSIGFDVGFSDPWDY
jgi:hypothetical protein